MSGVTQPPGWYPAEGDPPGTVRWWDGNNWVGGPQAQGAQQQAGYVAPGAGTLAIGRELADPWLRIAAKIIDFLITLLVSFLIAFAFGVPQDFLEVFNGTQDNISTGSTVVYGFVAGLFSAAYYTGFNTFMSGTPGKLMLGMRIVTEDGTEPLGMPAGIVRSAMNIAVILQAIPFLGTIVSIVRNLIISLISLIFLFSDPEHRTVMDRVAKTYVVKKSS